MGSDNSAEIERKEREERERRDRIERENRERREREERERREREERERIREYEIKMQQLKNEQERKRAEVEEKKRREEQRRKDEEEQKRIQREEEEKKKREKEEEIRRKENKINNFRNNQDIGLLLDLLIDFKYDMEYLVKTIEALNEDTIIEKFSKLNISSGGKIQVINEIIFDRPDNLKHISDNCKRKLIILLIFNEKESYKKDSVFRKIYDLNIYKNILFDILLYCDKYLGPDIKFENQETYKELVLYSIKEGKYLRTLNYLSHDIIQLNLLKDNIDKIFESKKNVSFEKLNENSYKDAYQLVEDIIKYQNNKGRKFISFPKTFWENYFNYYKLNTGIENKIQKLVELYELLISYSKLEPDDSEYKELLAENIHNIIENKIKEDGITVKEQLDYLFEKDPYYIYDDYKNKRDPIIFKDIKIFEIIKKEDVEYFKKKDLEKIYENSFVFDESKKDENEEKKNYFLNIIIERIKTIEHFILIINLIEIDIKKNEKNKNGFLFIKLLVKRYLSFEDKDLTEESFLILLDNIIKYSPDKRIEVLQSASKKFNQNYNIYAKLIEKYKEDNDLQKQIAISSFVNLESNNFIELLKIMGSEEKKVQLFENLGKENIVKRENFLNKEKTSNIQLLQELMKNKLIPQESSYFKDNKYELTTIFEKLTEFSENKKIYLDTILNEDKEIQKIFNERFKLFKLINEEKEFDPDLEFTKIIERYKRVKDYIEKANNISYQLSFYFKEELKEEMNKINDINIAYSNLEIEVKEWIYKEDELKEFINKYEDKSNLIAIIKEIKLFLLLYKEFNEGKETETDKFENAKKLLDECIIIFTDIYKGDQNILNKFQNLFKRERDNQAIEKELQKLKAYYKINEKDYGDVAKNIFIYTKKNIYKSDIKNLQYFLKLFNAEETELSKKLNEKKLEMEDEQNLNFEKLKNINDFFEDLKLYINNGRDDSQSIQLIRLLYNRENEIKFAMEKDIDSAAALMYKINPTSGALQFDDILQYQSCVDFVNDFNEKMKDNDILSKLREKLEKMTEISLNNKEIKSDTKKENTNVEKVIKMFEHYFIHFGSIKSLDQNFDGSEGIYDKIKSILNNSKFIIELFKREFKVYEDDNRKTEKKIFQKDGEKDEGNSKKNSKKVLDELIELKDNINLNFEDLPDDTKESNNKERSEKKEKQRKELEEKRANIVQFVKYIEQLQRIIKYFTILENKGCPFLIDIVVNTYKGEIKYELVNNPLKYHELIFKLKDYCNTMTEYQVKFYKENEYFRLVYEKQLYRLFKRTKRKDKDISSYVRFFTNGESTKDDVPLFESVFNGPFEIYKYYREAIKENFTLISKYIENIFKVNGTSLEKLYENIEIKIDTSLKGIFKCNINKYNVDTFIIKMFLKLTNSFPIAQNILLTNNETSAGEIYSFMYRSIKCRFHTLFIISISDDFSIQNLNIMTNLLNRIVSDMKRENTIKTIGDLKPCILFITHNQNVLGNSIDFPKEVEDLQPHWIGDENKLEYDLGDDSSKNSKSNEKSQSQTLIQTQSISDIYNSVKVYTSDCCGLGKSFLIKKEIKNNGEDYHYLGIGDDITKDDLFRKLKRFFKIELKGKEKVGIHLDLFYTKNTPLMQYFLFAFLITKLFQVNDNILYIPKKFRIYVEIPNGPQRFLDDFPVLKIFKTYNISLNNQEPLDIKDTNMINEIVLTFDKNKNEEYIKDIYEKLNYKNNHMTYIEKKLYMNIIYYLSSNKKDSKNYNYDLVKDKLPNLIKCIYSERLREPEIENKKSILNFLSFKDEDALKIQDDVPLIFKTKNGYEEINISDDKIRDKDLDYYLENLKKIMQIDAKIDVIKSWIEGYKITKDNYKKMVLILFKLFANIPVILMGETGCGKTELIKQLMKMLNNNNNDFLITKNMHSGVKENEITEVIEKAEKKLEKSKCNMICIFFDEINTTSLLSKMKEIFISHSLNGRPINEKIRFIGACNPYREREETETDNGLKMEKINEGKEKMAYLVNLLPNSMLYYIFYFKSLENDDVKKYIECIVGEEFPPGEEEKNKEQENIETKYEILPKIDDKVDKDDKRSEKSIFRDTAIYAIYQSHTHVRKKNGKSSVSLRDLQRFKRAYKFFNQYYKYKLDFIKENDDETISGKEPIKSKIHSFVLSLFITYYIRLFKGTGEYLEMINSIIHYLAKKFKITEWLEDKRFNDHSFRKLVEDEENFLLEQMNIRKFKGIGLNNSLKENIFLMFFSIYSYIPLIVVGKPGCSKSLSIQLIIRIMRGEFSESNFLKKYPTINSTGFQGSETNTPENIENIFMEAEKKIQDNDRMISLLVFDELGLSEKSPTNCLKVLHSKLEMSLNPNEKRLGFIGISNWGLDAAKMNRAIFLAIPDIGLDDIGTTVKAISDSYDPLIYQKYQATYEFLGNIFFKYKEGLKDLKNSQIIDEFTENYHGGRDLYHLIKIFSSEMLKNKMAYDLNKAVKISLLRNFSGLELKEEKEEKITRSLKYVLERTYKKGDNDENLKKFLSINFDDIKTIDLVKDNILSKDSRFLLLVSEKSMFDFLINIIKQELEKINLNSPDSDNKKITYVNYIGSPFKGDKINVSYQTEIIVNIENSVAEGKVIILSNLDQIYSIFYDLFNQNYIIKDNKKYCRISHGANIQKLALVNEDTKFIILVDNNELRKQKLPFLSRFEKHIITFESLLDEEDKKKSKKINELLKNLVTVKNINYDLDNILVNTNEDIINGYVYIYKNKQKNTYKNIIEDKIIPIIPQDIIFTLPFSELIKDKNEADFIKNSYSKKRPKSLEEYLTNFKKEKEKVLIAYTFSKIGEAIKLPGKESYMEKIASEIKTVFKFKQILNEFYDKENKEEYKYLIIKFNSDNAININFFISEIKHYKEINKITDDNKYIIFIINIQRKFDSKKAKKLTTVLITDEEINQIFIDNINGTELTIKDIDGKNINDLISKKLMDPYKIIVEGMLNFYGGNKNEFIGKCKGIDSNNFISEFKIYIENNQDLKDKIKNIILPKIGKTENIVNSIIEEQTINQNTIDFISSILLYMKDGFNKQLDIFLRKSENNNFFTTLFILSIKDNNDTISTIPSDSLNYYSFNKTDEQLLNNKLFVNIIKEFWKKANNIFDEKMEDSSINIKLYYKIPGFFNIYRGIKKYIHDEKMSFYFRQDELELRKSEYEKASYLLAKLKTDMKDFTEKLYVNLTSKQYLNRVIEAKTDDENYLEFTEVFLSDYITYYLVKLYKDCTYEFEINDISHKLILLLLDLKFKKLSEEEKFNLPLQNNVLKILWIESNANYIKEIIDLYNIIAENIVNDEKESDILFKNILTYISENKIKYEPIEKQLIKINSPYYIIIIALFKCMIDKKSIEKASLKEDDYYFYFKSLERCSKKIQKLNKSLRLDIKELSVLNDFITIYNVFEKVGKLKNLNIIELITNLTKSLEVIETNEENKIEILKENLKNLNEIIKKSLYDLTKNKEVKGDKIYYELISNLLVNEVNRENNLDYKLFILKDILLEDEKLLIQSNQLLKLLLNDFVSSDVDHFQASLNNLSDEKLKYLDSKTNNDWIKETLIYTFEQISIIYIQNYLDNKDLQKQNIMIYLKQFLNNCMNLLEKLYKDPELKKESYKEEFNININLKKLFALSFIRVYLKQFIDWIDKNNFSKSSEIKEIIDILNGEEDNKFRDMPMYFICKILYNNNKQDINILFNDEVIKKYQLDSYRHFDLIRNEKNLKESSKYIVFIEAYNSKDEDLKIFTDEFNLLNKPDDKRSELQKLIENNNRLDIFYSAFSAKISSHLSNSGENKDKINKLSDCIHTIFDDKEKLINIFNLFLDKSKYTKKRINSITIEILQFCLKYCINSDEISDDYENMYYPLYSGDKIINSYIPGNDIKPRNIYDCYSKIKKYLDENPSNHGVYICTCNKDIENKEIFMEFIGGNGYHSKIENLKNENEEKNEKIGKCKYCGQPIGNDGNQNSFFERESYYRVFKNEQDLEKETKNKINGNCITLDKFYKEFIIEKLENDSKGVNASKKSHFDKLDKPIRNQSQLCYRLMNLILYSHLFTNVLFKNDDEIFAYEGLTYLDYIQGNWDKLKIILDNKGINIYIFMNLIFKDLFNFLSKQKQIDNYNKLLDIEKEIEEIIENKIFKKTEKIKEKEFTKYAIFGNFYTKQKDVFREKDPNSKTSIIKEMNSPDTYKEEEYPYYKSFIYSDYPDENFLKSREEFDKEKYPVIDLYLNRGEMKNRISKEFILFNFVVKSLLNEFSNKISKNAAKKLTLEKTYLYKDNSKICDTFIKTMKQKIKDISKESSLENFLIDSSNEKGNIYVKMYEKYAEDQNNSLDNILEKINIANYEVFECQEIGIQEAQRGDLFILDFDKKSEFSEILLSNTFREIYMLNSKIKYNNYNLFSIDFEKIEKILEDIFIKNAAKLKIDEIAEMKYTGDEFLNDGISDLDKNINPTELNEGDKISFMKFYEKNLKDNLESCFDVNEGFKNIISYINKNIKTINNSKGIYNIISEGGFPYEICKDLKCFLEDNKNITISKLTNLMKYLERLYFELAMEKKGTEYKEKLNDNTKEMIDKYYKDKSGQLITKDKLSLTIIRFLLIDLMNQRNEKTKNRLFEKDDKLFDILSNKILWDEAIYKDDKFLVEIEEYKNLGISFQNTYDFYKYIATKSINDLEEEKKSILGKINNEEKEKLIRAKNEERDKKKEEIEKLSEEKNVEDVKVIEDNGDIDLDEIGDF